MIKICCPYDEQQCESPHCLEDSPRCKELNPNITLQLVLEDASLRSRAKEIIRNMSTEALREFISAQPPAAGGGSNE